MNAPKSGDYLKAIVTPDEREGDLATYERMHLAHYRPRTEFEKDQVQTLAVLGWRLRRYSRMESEILAVHGFEQGIEEGQEEFCAAAA